MKTFEQLLMDMRISHERSPLINDQPFKLYDLMSEGVIIPIDLKVNSLDVNELNNNEEFKKLKIFFDNSSTDSYYYNNKISIGTKDVRSKTELASRIGHELIHAVQDERSSKKYLNFHDGLEQLWKKAKKELDLDTLYKLRDEITSIQNFKNPYERMAYAYAFVKLGKENDNTLNEILNLVLKAYPEFKNDKQFMKYLYQYYEAI